MFNMKQVGKKIVSLRKSRNMTQTELADKMDVSFQAVSNWERGNSMPDISKLPQLAALFDCTVDELLDGRVELLHSAMEDGIQEYVEHNEVSKEELEAAVPILKPEQVEQLADSEQLTCLGYILKLMEEDGFDGKKTVQEQIGSLLAQIEKRGFAAIVGKEVRNQGDIPGNLAMPRREEIFACMNRYRGLKL